MHVWIFLIYWIVYTLKLLIRSRRLNVDIWIENIFHHPSRNISGDCFIIRIIIMEEKQDLSTSIPGGPIRPPPTVGHRVTISQRAESSRVNYKHLVVLGRLTYICSCRQITCKHNLIIFPREKEKVLRIASSTLDPCNATEYFSSQGYYNNNN